VFGCSCYSERSFVCQDRHTERILLSVCYYLFVLYTWGGGGGVATNYRGPGPVYISYTFVFPDNIIICRLYKWTTCRTSPSHSAANNEVFRFIVKILNWSALAGRGTEKNFYGSRTSCCWRCLYILVLSTVDCSSADNRYVTEQWVKWTLVVGNEGLGFSWRWKLGLCFFWLWRRVCSMWLPKLEYNAFNFTVLMKLSQQISPKR
jgi:hypothetical protein